MTNALYRDDAYMKSCETTVVRHDNQGIVLADTVFYAMGGGQPGDTGVIRRADGTEIQIVDTRKHKDEPTMIIHIPVEGSAILKAGESVIAKIDWERRYKHMRMHTSLHLLSAVVPFGVTGGAIHDDKSRLDFDMQEIMDKEDITKKLNVLIQASHPVNTQWITDEELDAQPELIKTMSVKPPRGAGKVRLLDIPGVDLQPCGGTHVANTNEIGPMVIKKVEKKGKHNRRVIVTFASD
ncbi:MAG: alanyl-tRNA editing protein [Gammaproteobacteria bacterium]|nr:alanyl-tRNA editing protein [Gammaproteobacteria bacterium]